MYVVALILLMRERKNKVWHFQYIVIVVSVCLQIQSTLWQSEGVGGQQQVVNIETTILGTRGL